MRSGLNKKSGGRAVRAMAVVTGVFAASALPAAAQEARAEAESSDAIVVRALRRDETAQIDRKIYRVDTDIQSFTGSAADVLNKIPSLDVDADGALSLRGDSNVTILIDGKPSGLTGGDALTQIPGADIARVEVMNNPPAEFKAEGSGGVVNIITKTNKSAGLSGTVRLSAGNEGRYQTGLSAAYNTKKLALSATLSFKDDVRKRRIDSETIVFAPPSASTQIVNEKSSRQSPAINLGADYTFDGGDKISAGFSRSERFGERGSAQTGETEDAAGALVRRSSRRGQANEWRLDHDARLDYERTLFTAKDKLKLSLLETVRRERNDYATVTSTLLPAANPELDLYKQNIDRTKREFQTDYELPLKEGDVFKIGYALENNLNRYNYPGATTDLATGIVTPYSSVGNDFRYDQWIHAGYGSFQTNVGDIGLLAGLRVEQTELDTRQAQGAVRNSTEDLRLYPSLHIERELGEEGKLSGSYSVRTARPDPEDLNPFVDRRDPNNLRAGNPALKARRTQSFELGYAHDGEDRSYRVTAYYRQHRNLVSDVTRALDADVVLTTKINLPEGRTGGLELGLNGKLPYKISYNLSGNIYYDEIDPGPFAAGKRSNVTGGGKASFDYKPTKADAWQISFNYTGERLQAQGVIRPMILVNAGYRRQINDRLAGVLTVTDMFNGLHRRRIYETPELRDDYDRHILGQVVSVGLVYTFGGKSKQKEKNSFQYDEGQ
jgi:outer membrane receptor protein involved in Fe transport